MPKLERPINIASEIIDQESREGLDNALRILAKLAVRKYLRERKAQEKPVASASSSVDTKLVTLPVQKQVLG